MPHKTRPNERKLFTTRHGDKVNTGDRTFHYKAQEWFIVTQVLEVEEDGENLYEIYGVPERIYHAGG